MQAGKSEAEALKEVFPIYKDERGRMVNTRRPTVLKEWKARGWFPPPEVSTEGTEDSRAVSTISEPTREETPPVYVTREEFLNTTAEITAQLTDLRESMNSFMNLSEQLGQPIHPRNDRSGGDEYPEAPPAPPLQGKKQVTDRKKVSVTVDPVLFKMMEGEAGKRGFTLSRMVDVLAWHYFDRPHLSFESNDE